MEKDLSFYSRYGREEKRKLPVGSGTGEMSLLFWPLQRSAKVFQQSATPVAFIQICTNKNGLHHTELQKPIIVCRKKIINFLGLDFYWEQSEWILLSYTDHKRKSVGKNQKNCELEKTKANHLRQNTKHNKAKCDSQVTPLSCLSNRNKLTIITIDWRQTVFLMPKAE